jgi:hypothetical protein
VDRAYTAVHIEEDRHHWYFRGRLAVLLAVLERALPTRSGRLLDLGCGHRQRPPGARPLRRGHRCRADPELRAVGQACGLDIRPGSLPDDLPVPGAGRMVSSSST